MTTAIERTVTLANGAVMPTLAFGTWQIPLNDHFKSVIRTAIDLGYRHFDTAQIYNNAKLLGEAIRESRVDRSEFFISCKLWASHRSYESAREAFEAVCTQLGFDTIDLLSVHWPAAQGEPMVWQSQNAGIWRTLEELLAEERVRAIGVANFLPHHLVPLLARAKVRPMVNQLEIHPGYPQEKATAFSRARGIAVQSWSPLGRGLLAKHPLLAEIGSAHGISAALTALRWNLQAGALPIVKSTDPAHMRENLRVFDFELSEEEMSRINAMQTTAFSGLHPDTVNF